MDEHDVTLAKRVSRFFIKTTETTSIINGTTMFVDNEYLWVYDGEELIGMYLASGVLDAHRTEGK